MTPHRLRRVALQRTRKRSQRDPQDFYHGLLAFDSGVETDLIQRTDRGSQASRERSERQISRSVRILSVGGGGGTRTHVRRTRPRNVYVSSRRFNVSPERLG